MAGRPAEVCGTTRRTFTLLTPGGLMRIRGSRFGWLLVALYVLVFVAEYTNAKAHSGIFLGDIGLQVLALPYIGVIGRLLLQSPTFAVHAHEPWGLVPAVLFCSAVVWLIGAGLEHLGKRLLRRRAPERSAGPPP